MDLNSLDFSELAEWPDATLEDVVEAVGKGARTPAEALGMGPDALNGLERIALGYYRARHFDKAAMIYGSLLQLSPERSSAWRGLGAVCQAQKHYYLAVRCYEKAAEQQPDDVVTHVLWGECLCLAERREAGVAQLREVLARADVPRALRPYLQRAEAIVKANGSLPARVVLMKHGRTLRSETREALAASGFEPRTDGVTLDPDQPLAADDIVAHPSMGPALQELGALMSEGGLTYREVGGFTETEMTGAYACACRYVEQGQTAPALQILSYLIFLDSYDSRFYHLAGICTQRLKQYEAAEYFYRAALAIDEDDVSSRIYLGETLIMTGRTDAGLAELHTAQAKVPGDASLQPLQERSQILIKQFGS